MGRRGRRRSHPGGGRIAAQGEVKLEARTGSSRNCQRAIHARIQVKANKYNKMNGLRRVFAVTPLMD
jgi:hypothetical protein